MSLRPALWFFVLLCFCAALSRCDRVHALPKDDYNVQRPGLWWDETRWSMVPLPDSMIVCRKEGTAYHCLVLPPGSVLFIPTPGDSL